ncbi:BTB/POZ and MATH domain-containing protein 1-like [Triticum dicoccoides]|uniref:BTB/POZ and MATH domain-containing protein 1-like n=1 Tax=Triticum dicoccoides TaxID=85692 RepID=UPI00188E228E|nr:BTB/POZ and MATH domain-containing protein 1-like [Triticum dicoccoides]
MAQVNAAAAVDHGEGLRVAETSSRCVTEGATHDFVVTNYPLLDGMGFGRYIRSSTFTVGGYDWNIRFYPDGGKEDAAGNAGAYLCCLCQLAKYEVRAMFTLTMLDDQGHVQETRQLPGQLERTLKDGIGADVTILVGGRRFRAHRFMLAMRAPLLDAQIFGPTMEVADMEPDIFQILLHYVYTDSLPPCDGQGYSTAAVEHLLAAADRYGLGRLKAMCQGELCGRIDANTVMATLALADQYICERLKDACLEFLSSEESMIAVIATDRFKHLIKSFPMLDLEKSPEDLARK